MEDIPDSNLGNAAPEGFEELPPPLPPLGILSHLSDRSLTNMATYGRYQKSEVGEVLITEGEVQDRFYVVVSGKLTITALASGKEVFLSNAEPGECLIGHGAVPSTPVRTKRCST